MTPYKTPLTDLHWVVLLVAAAADCVEKAKAAALAVRFQETGYMVGPGIGSPTSEATL